MVYIEIFFFLFWNFCVTYILFFFFYICCRYELQRRSTTEFTMLGVSTWEVWYRQRMPRLRRFQFNYTRQCRCHNYFRYVFEKASVYYMNTNLQDVYSLKIIILYCHLLIFKQHFTNNLLFQNNIFFYHCSNLHLYYIHFLFSFFFSLSIFLFLWKYFR